MDRLTAAAVVLCVVAALSASSLADPVNGTSAQTGLQAGDLIVTGFSGTTLAAEGVPPGVDPLDKTFIDVGSPSLRVFNASGLNGTPAGKVVGAPVRLRVPAKDIGQVFGVAIDPGENGGPPRIFTAATSAFGLRVVGAGTDGKPTRLKTGAPEANFMEGQFGTLGSDSPGAIYAIDGTTGAASYIADTAFSGTLNNGPGIGGLAYDPTTRTLYASDLDSGLIHRFGLDFNAADLGQFDHGVVGRRAAGLETVADDGKRLDITSSSFKADDPSTWGITQPARRVDALAVHDSRLYYAVADGPQVWSVGLNGGDFGSDPRLEVDVKADKSFPITGITFDAAGRMLIAQRGTVNSPYDYGSFTEPGAQVLRYTLESPDDATTPGLWRKDPESYAVGTADSSNAGSGGVGLQYGYKPDGSIDLNTCDASVAFTGDTLGTTTSGVQLNAVDLVRPANVPPTQSAYIDYDAQQEDANARGHVGSVTAMRRCGADQGFPPIAGGSGDAFPPVEGGGGGDTAFPPVSDGGAGTADGGGGQTFPPVEDGGDGTTAPDETTDGGGGETTDVGGVSITKAPGAGTCTDKGGCAFDIDVTNNSGKALPELVIGDELTAGAANLAGSTIEGAVPAPWTCTAPPKFTCKHPGPIADGETVSLPLTFKPTGIGQEKELKNCATLGAAANPAPANPPPVVPEPTSSEENGLKFEQKALTQPCTTGQACEWEIKVTNNNADARTGNFVWFTDFAFVKDATNVRASAISIESVTSANPQAVCVPINNDISKQMRCAAELVTIPPGQSFTAKVKVKADAPANAPTATLQSSVSTDFTDTKQDQTIGKAVATAALVPPGQPGQQAGDGGAAEPGNPVCATLPVEQAADPVKQDGQLVIEKTAQVTSCSAIGGGCLFKIVVSNPGPGDFNGDIEFDDETTFLDQKLGVEQNSSLPNGCKHDHKGTMNCKIPGPLKAGDPPLEFTLDLVPTEKTDAGSIRNCATLKGTNTKSCAEIPLRKDKTPLLRAIKTLESGDCAPECQFVISVRNVGEGEFDGTFAFFDEPLKQGPVKLSPFVPLNAEVTAVQASNGVTCPAGVNPVCSFTGKIQPNGSVGATFKMIAKDKAFNGLNCGKVSGKNVDNEQVRQRCVEISRDGQGETPFPNLSIEKRAVGPMKGSDVHCDLKKDCFFIITITNTGTGDHVGPIKVQDTIKLGVPAVIQLGPNSSPGFTCKTVKNGGGGTIGGNNTTIDCETPGAPSPAKMGEFVPLKPGQSITLGIQVTPGDTWKGSEVMNNCAKLVGDNDGPLKGDKERCARVTLDPFDVKVVKTGDQNCQPGGECRFDIDIFDPGPIPHRAPVTVTDKLSGLSSAEIVSITQASGNDPFPCKPAPTKIPFTCTGDMDLEIGEHNHYTMVVRLPADASAKSFSNCATVGGARSDEGADQSCHSVTLGPPDQPFALKIAKTGPATCAPGSECSFALTLSNPGAKEHVGTISLTDGLSGVPEMPIVAIDPPLPCTQQPKSIPFNCGTSSDFRLGPGASRAFTVTARVPRSADDFTNCIILSQGGPDDAPTTTADRAISSCHSVKVSKTPPKSEDKCQGGMVLMDEGLCACPPDTAWNGRNCITRRPAEVTPLPLESDGGRGTIKTCPRSLPVGTYPNCCQRDTHFDPRVNPPRGACVPDGGGANTSKGVDEPKECPRGTRRVGKTCQKPVCPTGMFGEWPRCCPNGSRFEGGKCVLLDKGGGPSTSKGGDDEPKECPRGTRRVGKACEKIRCPTGMFGDWPRCCPNGTRFEGGKCVKPGTGDGGADTSKGGDEPKECPRGTRRVGKTCEKIRCPAGMFGDWPRCCPNGTRFEGGKCVKPGTGDGGADTSKGDDTKRQCPRGSLGKYPNCKCPVGWLGTPPNCCPPGTKFQGGKCMRPAGRCTDGKVGTPPNCSCPAGTHEKRSGGCEPNASPSQKPPPAKTEPTKAKCTGGRRGTPPNCFCIPPAKFLGGRCRRIPTPTPQKQEDKVIVR
jgi:hypothetical protein